STRPAGKPAIARAVIAVELDVEGARTILNLDEDGVSAPVYAAGEARKLRPEFESPRQVGSDCGIDGFLGKGHLCGRGVVGQKRGAQGIAGTTRNEREGSPRHDVAIGANKAVRYLIRTAEPVVEEQLIRAGRGR